jgi:hypothetical protein
MAKRVQADNNGLAVLTWLSASALLYIVWVLFVVGLLQGAMDGIAREGVWRLILFFLILQVPQVVAVTLAALLTRALVRPFNRMLLYYVSVAVIIVGSCVYAITLLLGFKWNGIVLAALQFGIAWAAWRAVRWVWNPTPEASARAVRDDPRA